MSEFLDRPEANPRLRRAARQRRRQARRPVRLGGRPPRPRRLRVHRSARPRRHHPGRVRARHQRRGAHAWPASCAASAASASPARCARAAAQVNPKLPTGDDRGLGRHARRSSRAPRRRRSRSRTTSTPNEAMRLKYRYLDLRRPALQKNFIDALADHQTTRATTSASNGFLEIETPFMVKYTPGGARNFLVPSRLNPGKFYALAESPQIFKQLFMVAGYRPLLPDRALLPRRGPAPRSPARVHADRRRDVASSTRTTCRRRSRG